VVSASLADKNELIIKAFNGVYLIKIDVDEWGWGPNGFPFDVIPIYFKIDSQGKATGAVIDGGAWGPDTPENIARAMDEFFHGK
jgi:hypothetical protein